MRVLLILAAVVISGCETLTNFMSDDAGIAVKVATAQAIYKNDDAGSSEVCERAFRAIELASQARAISSQDMLSTVDVKAGLSGLVRSAGLDPVTATLLLDITENIAAEYEGNGIALSEATITIDRLLDAIESVAFPAHEGC